MVALSSTSPSAVPAADPGVSDLPLPPLRLGCDICQIATIREMLQSDSGALERIFSAEERSYDMATAQPEQHLAGIFSAKEALAKATRIPGLLGRYYQQVTITHRDDGSPVLSVSVALAEVLSAAGIQIVDVSISHDGDYSVAMVLVAIVPESSVAAGQSRSATERTETGAHAGNDLRCYQCFLSVDCLAAQRVTDVLIPIIDGKGRKRYVCPPCLRGW